MVFPHMFRTEHTETKTTSSSYGEFYEWKKLAHISLDADTAELLKYVDDCREEYVKNVTEAIAIPSVSGNFEHREDVTKMVNFVEKWLKKLKIKYECFDVGWQKIDGLCCKLPAVILASLGRSRKKRTLCIYSHIDVTSPEGQKWDTDPWTVTEKNKKLYGKGLVSGKGVLMSWFHTIQAYQRNKIELPVNLKFIIEAMNEHNSEGLEGLLKAKKPNFLLGTDCVVICESEWLGQKYPCLTYGCAGSCRFEVTVEKNNDSDPEKDMAAIFATIVNEQGKIIIPHYLDDVEQITPSEENLYDKIDFNFEEIRPTLPPNRQHWDKVQMLMSFWRLPDIVVGDDEVCNCEKNDTTSTIKRKFVLKIVPKQFPAKVAKMVTSHIYDVCKTMECQSKVVCEMVYGARPWLVDFKEPHYEAARRASIQVYKEEPNLIREDREIPILLMLWEIVESRVLLLPIGCAGSHPRSGNENIALRNFFEGIKLMIAFLKQFSHI